MKFTAILMVIMSMAIPMVSATAIPQPRGSEDSPPNTTNLGDHPPAPCALHARYDGDWNEGGYARFGVTATANGSHPLDLDGFKNDKEMLEEWIKALDSESMKQRSLLLR